MALNAARPCPCLLYLANRFPRATPTKALIPILREGAGFGEISGVHCTSKIAMYMDIILVESAQITENSINRTFSSELETYTLLARFIIM